MENLQNMEMNKRLCGKILDEMNVVIEEMHAIQSVGEEDAYTAIEEDAQIIYKNFNAVVTMVNSNENISGITKLKKKHWLH